MTLVEIRCLTTNFGQQDALTADAVENFLRQNEIPVLVDKGGRNLPSQIIVKLIHAITSRPVRG